ncbi:MAG: hypothetical protein H6741_19300 [Alphaproteobacteria bacterium]|nr:hypothetical protein [Alphaproteobacteria bacterium]
MMALALCLILGGCTFWKELTDRVDTGTPAADSGGGDDDTGVHGDDSRPDDDSGSTDDSGTPGPLDVDCDLDAYSTAAPAGPGCLSGTIACGETVYGTTDGGDNLMEADLYRASFCFVPYGDYDGPERVYALEIPRDTRATVHIDTSCTDLAHAIMRWPDEDRCPYGDQFLISECEGDDAGSGGTEVLEIFNPGRFLVVIDGDAGVTGNFGIQVECESF